MNRLPQSNTINILVSKTLQISKKFLFHSVKNQDNTFKISSSFGEQSRPPKNFKQNQPPKEKKKKKKKEEAISPLPTQKN
jgi:hypothetical protein